MWAVIDAVGGRRRVRRRRGGAVPDSRAAFDEAAIRLSDTIFDSQRASPRRAGRAAQRRRRRVDAARPAAALRRAAQELDRRRAVRCRDAARRAAAVGPDARRAAPAARLAAGGRERERAADAEPRVAAAAGGGRAAWRALQPRAEHQGVQLPGGAENKVRRRQGAARGLGVRGRAGRPRRPLPARRAARRRRSARRSPAAARASSARTAAPTSAGRPSGSSAAAPPVLRRRLRRRRARGARRARAHGARALGGGPRVCVRRRARRVGGRARPLERGVLWVRRRPHAVGCDVGQRDADAQGVGRPALGDGEARGALAPRARRVRRGRPLRTAHRDRAPAPDGRGAVRRL